MAKYCPIAKKVTNCTDNCTACLAEEERNNNELHADLRMEQREQM